MPDRKETRESLKDVLKIWAPIGLVVVLGFVLAIRSLDPPPPTHLKIAAGSRDGAYHAFAEQYRESMAQEGYELEVLETAGSGENIGLLRSGEVDLALLQGGTATEVTDGELESLASLFFEPVWIFFRRDLAITRLADLEGRRIAVGTAGSGTRALALRLLEASGLGPGNCELLEVPSAEAARALAAGTADAGLFVASITASYIESLLRDEELGLMSFRRHRAYSRWFPFLSRVVLGEGVFDLDENVPSQDVSLLAAAASLVARSDLHEGLIPLVLETARRAHGTGEIFEDPGQFPSTQYVELPMNAEARLYLEQGPTFLHRFLSFRLATAIDRLKILILPFITLLIPLFRVAPPLYRWRIRSRIYRWYEDLHAIDKAVRQGMSAEELESCFEKVRRLEQELADEVSVPLSYMDEYYRLRDHIDLVGRRLERHAGSAGDREDLTSTV